MGKPALVSPWIEAAWDVPSCIRAGISTRHGGRSLPPYDSLNLARHVGDPAETVESNRRYLRGCLGLPSEPVWLEQVHDKRIIEAGHDEDRHADGVYTCSPGRVCVVMTADCLPLLLCNNSGTKVASIHVGWRGYCAGIVSGALTVFKDDPGELAVWIGPHISQRRYEVGEEVYRACLHRRPEAQTCFNRSRPGHWYASLEKLVRQELTRGGVDNVISAGMCTFERSSEFFSYRRNRVTGRMASMIWIESRSGG